MTSSESKILDEVEQSARDAELNYHGCSRSTLYGLKQHFDFIPDELVRAATALGGGCSWSGGSCGAYCGGLLAIGLKFSPPIEDLSDEGLAKGESAREKRLAFKDLFLKEFGTTFCPEIQERLFGRRFDFMDEKEREELLNLPGHHEKCASVVSKGARLAAQILLEIK
jgi:C_GCAxxG_C_C family probable redox protein